MQGARPSYSVVAIAVSDGHQCQPSPFIVCAILAPDLPNGSGGIGEQEERLGDECGEGRDGQPGDLPVLRTTTSRPGCLGSQYATSTRRQLSSLHTRAAGNGQVNTGVAPITAGSSTGVYPGCAHLDSAYPQAFGGLAQGV